MTSTNRNPLVITAGEPAGIGPDLCLALAQTEWSDRVVVIADPEILESRARQLGVDVTILSSGAKKEGAANHYLRVLRQPLINASVCGTPDPANAKSLLAGLNRAVKGCIDGEFSGLVTAPLQKSTINDAGISFTGHTEYLAELTSTQTPVMLLVTDTMRVALASTHMPLRQVPDYLTKDRLRNVIEVLHADLITKFHIAAPEIVVCGLNPHAGEGGYLGEEDAAVIEPVINEYQLRGMIVRGPLPADTAFTPAAGHADAVLTMYHDQGLPVLKYAGFGKAVNVTLGLPIIRTSVDHGTALDIAGTGKADAASMIAAVELAAELAGV
ncbi:MAG: 4-hydroxythreonine-4-phosphate dehydrogenase PdxA [Proteobacteria bacterium]|nr:4-hydroxythreonine-4-phosphate dehydrogenase PdxA [Pseudomonadota bacterium]MCH8308090.1 4-hydroxythreonine-4-phosphate dehydrogenase PdxA [Pseudomonadota bacterium]